MFDKLKRALLEDDGSGNQKSSNNNTNVTPSNITIPNNLQGVIIKDTIDEVNNSQYQLSQSLTQSEVESKCQKEVSIVLQGYKEEFSKMNKAGYDFYEFFNAIMATNSQDNLEAYKMAFHMATSMDPGLTPQKLAEQANDYTKHIISLHDSVNEDGNKKLNKVISEKEQEVKSIIERKNYLVQEIQKMQNELNALNESEGGIDKKYVEILGDIDCKLKANTIAKNDFVESINKVRDNIVKIVI